MSDAILTAQDCFFELCRWYWYCVRDLL